LERGCPQPQHVDTDTDLAIREPAVLADQDTFAIPGESSCSGLNFGLHVSKSDWELFSK